MDTATWLASRFAERHPADAARSLRALPPPEVAAFVTALEPEQADAVLGGMHPTEAAACLEALDADRRRAFVDRMPVDTAARSVRYLSPDTRQALIEAMAIPRRRRLERALRYGDETAASLADVDPPTTTPDQSAEVAARRSQKRSLELPYVYVTDRHHRLVGVVSRSELQRVKSDTPVADVMQHQVRRLPAFTPLGELQAHPAWRDWDVLPVVDGAGELIGVLRHKVLRRHVDAARRREANPPGAGSAVALGVTYCDLLARMLVFFTTSTVAADAGRTEGAKP